MGKRQFFSINAVENPGYSYILKNDVDVHLIPYTKLTQNGSKA